MMSSSPAAFSPDHLAQQTPAEQLCYVHCNLCDTILAVGVPCNSLFKTVTVRCGHCTNLLSVNLQGLLLPAAAAAANEQLNFGHALPSPTSPHGHLDEMPLQMSNLPLDQANAKLNSITSSDNRGGKDASAMSMALVKATTKERDLRKSSTSVNRPPEKRQRVPSAYNRFIKEEIQRIKSSNPDITHREAFSAAAKNWAHFPHIHFGLMSDQGHKKTSIRHQEGMEDMLFKDGLYAAAAAASMGVTPL